MRENNGGEAGSPLSAFCNFFNDNELWL